MKTLVTPPWNIIPREAPKETLPAEVPIHLVNPVPVFELEQDNFFRRYFAAEYVSFNGHKRRATAIERGIERIPIVVPETTEDLKKLFSAGEWPWAKSSEEINLPFSEYRREFTNPAGIISTLQDEEIFRFGIGDAYSFLKRETSMYRCRR